VDKWDSWREVNGEIGISHLRDENSVGGWERAPSNRRITKMLKVGFGKGRNALEVENLGSWKKGKRASRVYPGAEDRSSWGGQGENTWAVSRNLDKRTRVKMPSSADYQGGWKLGVKQVKMYNCVSTWLERPGDGCEGGWGGIGV